MTIDMFSTAREFEHTDVETVVVFVDMAGFTAFTEARGDHGAAQLADTFTTVAEMVLGPGDEIIKTIGDAVMITSQDALEALAFLRRLHDETRRIPGFPLLRAGVCAGPVVKRRGDVFGSTVNTAARLAAVAQPGQIVADEKVASAIRGADPLVPKPLGRLQLRNVSSPVAAFALDVGTHHQEHVDPICRVHVATDIHQLTVTQRGTQYRFCSTACLHQFVRRALDETVLSGDADAENRTAPSSLGGAAVNQCLKPQICQSWAPSFSS